MSIDRPSGAELLAEARRTLLERLLPLLPAEHRYDGLMVANAMAIAARELSAPAGLPPEAVAVMDRRREGEEKEAPHALAALERRLAAEFRAGRYDAPGAERDAARRYLRAATLARLRVSNPKSLEE